jgi:hypothetical protein
MSALRTAADRVRRNCTWFVARLIPLGLLFAAVYGLNNAFASGRAATALALPWERAIPLVSAAIWIYLSICLVFWLPLAVLERNALGWLMKRYVAVTLLAGAVFLVFPTSVALQRPGPDDAPSVYTLLYALDAPYNAAPSLHVAYTVLILVTCARALSGGSRAAVLFWLALVVASTWLTRQHQLVDIVTGALLGGLSSLGNGAGAGSATGSMPRRHMRRYWPT